VALGYCFKAGIERSEEIVQDGASSRIAKFKDISSSLATSKSCGISLIYFAAALLDYVEQLHRETLVYRLHYCL
jgi:hypothetical protein